MRDVLTRGGVPFVEAEDEAAFYGPKVDVQIWSAIGREFTLATNQVDFAQPGRFDLVYTCLLYTSKPTWVVSSWHRNPHASWRCGSRSASNARRPRNHARGSRPYAPSAGADVYKRQAAGFSLRRLLLHHGGY